jgi:L-ascorbate metabolism protein UlaG (beta-lactamase superfamily)
MSTPLYLKPNIQLEPLIDRWYAWPYLIPPATAARCITERHFEIMESYIHAPRVHAQAVKNPNLIGGPFIDYDGRRVDEIRALLDETRRTRSRMIDLSAAISKVDEILRTEGKGLSMAPLYEKIPNLLRGYIELVYDLNNCPSYRIFEPLLYKSHFYTPSSQSLMISPTKGDRRPFALSTPRLDDGNSVHLPLPFYCETANRLLRMRYRPENFEEIEEMLGLDSGKSEIFRTYLTQEPPPINLKYDGEGVRWRYFGHASVLLETKHTSILFDPVLSYSYPTDVSRFTYYDTPDIIDYVILTHNHEDHVLFETLLQLRSKIRNIVIPRNGSGSLQDPSLKLILQKIGFKDIIEICDMDSIPIEGGEITGVPFIGEHCDLDIKTKSAYAVRVNGRSFLFAADSCNLEPNLYEHIRRDLGEFDTLFIGMECDGAPMTWLYKPFLTQRLDRDIDESRRIVGSNCQQAMEIVKRFNFREVYIYAMGQEPWLSHIRGAKSTPQSRPIVESNRLIQTCRNQGVYSERLYGCKEMILE